MRDHRKRNIYLLATTLIAGIVLTGCGADSSDESTQSSAGRADSGAKAAAPERAADAPAAEAPTDGKAEDSTAKAPDLAVDQRSIIYRGSVSVRVPDVDAAAGQATGIASTAGGFIGADNRSSGGTAMATATIQLRVPADKFAGTVNQLSRLGKEETREINTEDVTEQTVDLDARIKVQQARVDSGRKLLAQAKTLNDLVMLEKEVATRESDLASLQAKQRRLADLTALSTITVTFLGPVAASPAPKEDDDPGFLSGLSAGWHALLASLKVLLTVLGALLPWLIALGLPALAVFYAYRRYRNRTGASPALVPLGPPLPPGTPAPAEPADGKPTE